MKFLRIPEILIYCIVPECQRATCQEFEHPEKLVQRLWKSVEIPTRLKIEPPMSSFYRTKPAHHGAICASMLRAIL